MMNEIEKAFNLTFDVHEGKATKEELISALEPVCARWDASSDVRIVDWSRRAMGCVENDAPAEATFFIERICKTLGLI